mgnify:CR=1 FL=1|tara:strand:+ start:4256 stop:4648 length:393 start_codon:yes stop_codon:yes gene_type:complete
MNPLALIKAVAAPVLKIIDDFVPDKDLAAKLKSEISTSLIELDTKTLEAQRDVIVAEAQGHSWLQRNWRPLLMLWFAFLVGCYWFGFTAPNLDVSTINNLLDIVLVGVGGYVVGRSGEKIATTIAQGMKK